MLNTTSPDAFADDTIDELVRASEHIVRVQKGVIDTLQQSIQETEKALKAVAELRTLLPKNDTELARKWATDALSHIVDRTRNACIRLYQSASKLPYKGLDPAERMALEGCGILGNEVLAVIKSHTIFVKTPLLWTRDLSRRSDKTKSKNDPERFQIFSDTVAQKVQDAGLYEAANLLDFREKTIQFLFVYNKNPNKKIFVIDNDNHITKYVQDAVTILLPGGDCGLSATNYRSSVVTNLIPEGSYLVVNAGKNTPLPEDEIVAFWAAEIDKANK